MKGQNSSSEQIKKKEMEMNPINTRNHQIIKINRKIQERNRGI
jgi:hypothetical protein